MPSAEVAERYFAALGRQDLDAAVACWTPGGVDVIAGEELVAPDGVRAYFSSLFQAFPDFALQVIGVTADGERAAVRWRADATFAGPGSFQGFEPNGARLRLEGCDVLLVEGERIRRNDAYLDSGELARQLGVLPPAGSPSEQRLTRLANLRTRLTQMVQGSGPEQVATGVWVVRGGFPLRTMNVYLIEDGDGVTVFDAGISDMAKAVEMAAVRMGGVRQIVLGHADFDHRGVAPALGAPVLCHERDRDAAESPEHARSYFDLTKLHAPVTAFYRRILPVWDGGPVKVSGTLAEGDEVAGFRVVELPGHAPGLIGLYRESDRLVLCSDCIYTLDPQTGRKGAARVPHQAFNLDTEQARASIRKLAALEPAAVWAGHADPVTGDVHRQLVAAADAR